MKLAVAPETLADLKTAQRLFRLSARYSSVEALKKAGYLSRTSGVYVVSGRHPQLATAAQGCLEAICLATEVVVEGFSRSPCR